MKRLFAAILIGTVCCGILAGCSGAQKEGASPPVQNPSSTEAAKQSGGVVDNNADEQRADTTSSAKPSDDGIVDLTQLSSTMVYAEVYNMMMTPEEYIGKTIKTNGIYYASHNPQLNIYYHFIMIEDATACCAQGLEFMLNGEHTYPDSYPTEDTPIEISGIWDSYQEDGNIYYYIATNEIAIL